ncbi:hypothetical protein A3354_000589 [Campylobacter jejuni]|uniref:hypothetical protein n=1 Tax=Campylobacter jejuni TaxID=197 RepID=UPI0013BF26EC|nr:hypothetical protein [Campylobacter jejuni]EEA8295903.1 hypothetical protein [Campylobacter coli]EDP3744635.1 hypothetical protein [Campylobacter jejuni]EEU4918002.1 hypothetical protein [Campylobacter jejuni]EEY4844790.1 hypothetical protein [Campylobacter jejuni]EFP6164227.1 hypothetical protein [Campylobacter jejuni]
MKKALIWGTGPVGMSVMWHISLDYEIIGFIDSDKRRHSVAGGGELRCYKI